MIENVNILLSESFEKIISSELSLLLLRTYSALYLNGSQVSFCSNCMNKYYEEIKINGMEKAINYEAAKTRTLVLKDKSGIMYVTAICSHIDLDLLTDDVAIDYLNKGYISKNLFEKLPEGFEVEQNEETKPKVTKKNK